ncbi:hypothetical protein SLS53_006468 [Cytospora paraplurivora]|uniref:Caudal-like activation domain-containing protein n=1 Tax=Cytospora paraplurivora TaxID=2898453 RepID=A0AAN9YE51_9PEZI
MAHGYGHHSVYAQPRPDWSGYGQPGAPITPGHHVFPQTPSTAAQSRPNQYTELIHLRAEFKEIRKEWKARKKAEELSVKPERMNSNEMLRPKLKTTLKEDMMAASLQ